MEVMEQKEKKAKLLPKLRFGNFSDYWKKVKLSQIILNYRLGGNYENVEVETNYPLIKMGNLGRGNIILDKLYYIAEAEKIDSNDKIEFGDLFFNTRNTLDLVGKVAIWRNELSLAYYNSNLMCMSFENNFFMNYRFNSYEGVKKLRSLATGTTSVAAIYTKDLLKIEIAIPTLPEQQKIAAFLGAVDKKIQLLQRQKELLEQYKKGLMQQLFSGKLRFKPARPSGGDDKGKAFPKWEERKLNQLGNTFNGLTGKTNEDFGKGKPYIQYKQVFDNARIDINKCGFVEIIVGENQEKVQHGDIFFTTSSETPNEVGFSSVLLERPTEMYLNSFCFGLRPYSKQSLLPDFCIYLFRSQQFRKKLSRLAQGSTRYNLSKVEFLKLSINLPSKQEQQKIAAVLSGLDKKLDLLSQQLSHSQHFKKGLLQQMFV